MSGSIAALFQRLTQGVYVVGVAHGEVRNAFTAAWVMHNSTGGASRPILSLETSRPGVFAIGDVRAGSTKRVAAAVGEGAAVVPEIHQVVAAEPG